MYIQYILRTWFTRSGFFSSTLSISVQEAENEAFKSEGVWFYCRQRSEIWCLQFAALWHHNFIFKMAWIRSQLRVISFFGNSSPYFRSSHVEKDKILEITCLYCHPICPSNNRCLHNNKFIGVTFPQNGASEIACTTACSSGWNQCW